MFKFKLSLTNPQWTESDRFDVLWCKPFGLTTNKTVEFQLSKTDELLAVEFDLRYRCDHSGADLWLGLLGFAFSVAFYDNRHLTTNEE